MPNFTAKLPMVLRWLIVCLMLATDVNGAESFDLILRGARIVDGTGAPWYFADIGIRGDKIVAIGSIDRRDGENSIDVSGLIVAPGFIDMMGQTATPLLDDSGAALNLLTQGITTINAGEGVSAAPLSDDEGLRKGYTTMAEYFALLDSKGLPVNVVQTVGHTQIRQLVLGDSDRRPSDSELERMQQYVREAMEAGAIGVSTALIYPPAVYADTREIAALAKVAGEYGGSYFTHMRNESDQLLEAIDEALSIGRAGNVPVHIFHLKTAGQQNWGKMPLAIARIKQARAEGQQVTADIYPYINNGLGITALIHPRHFVNGVDALRKRLDDPMLRATIRQEMESTSDWENWYRNAGSDWQRIRVGRTSDPQYAGLAGLSVADIAKSKEEDPWDTFFRLVRSETFALPETMTHANKILAMQQEFVSFCTDVGPAAGEQQANSMISAHPRAYGSFPRLISYYVRDLGAISLERAIAQASATAANDVKLYDRGRIAVGLAADLIAFDYEHLADKADFSNPRALSTGMRYVIVNGQLVLAAGEPTKSRPGRVLRGPGWKRESAAANIATGDEKYSDPAVNAMLVRFMEEHAVPGMSIAIADRGTLIYSQGFGYADVAKQTPVTPQSLFRIASVSKPITGVAVMQLVEQGKLTLDAKVTEILDLSQGILRAGEKFDPRWHQITVRHLLQHRGGWDRDVSFDAMFRSVSFAEQEGLPPPASPSTVIQAMLKVNLDFDPGLRYAYSNFGYSLLGRIIEKISQQDYETYVREHVLAPVGVTEMRIGASLLTGRRENEVRYYQPGTGTSVFASDLGNEVPWPYGGWYLEAMDAHGGWIASAEDLIRFATALDNAQSSPLLNETSIKQLFERPEGEAGYEADGREKEVYYSLGWSNRVIEPGAVSHWHTGSLNGTATVLIRRHDGLTMVALMNSRVSPKTDHLGRESEVVLHRAASYLRSKRNDNTQQSNRVKQD